MSDTATNLVKAVLLDASRSERSNQIEVGPSELGSCSRQMWYKLNGSNFTNLNTLHLPSIFGTAIHSHFQKVVEKLDPERFLTEIEVSFEGMKGHIDIYDQENKEVIDWKSTTKKNQGYFPTKSQIWQVQVYAYLLNKTGKEVEKVTLVSIARDGTENDILHYSESYDEAKALDALNWLINIEQMVEPPAPEKDVYFCRGYCPFYDATGEKGCAGRIPNPKELTVIDDEMFISAAEDYLDLSAQIKELEARQESARAILEGQSGQTPTGIKVLWSETAGRSTIDESEILEKMGYVPKKTGKPSLRLSVKQ